MDKIIVEFQDFISLAIHERLETGNCFYEYSGMQVNIFSTLRLVSGKKTVQVDLPGGATLRDFLEEIIRQIPAMQSALMKAGSSLRQDLPLFVNGRNPRLLPESIDMALQPGDLILSPDRSTPGAARTASPCRPAPALNCPF